MKSTNLDDLRVGDFVAGGPDNVFSAREVLAFTPNGDVQYRSYDLITGRPFGCSSGVCSVAHLERWTARKPTPEELERIRPYVGRPTEAEINRHKELVEAALACATKEQLLTELLRREPR